MYDESKPHRSTHEVNGVVVDTTTTVEYKIPRTDTFKFKKNVSTPQGTKSVIVNESGDSENPKPSWGFTL